MKPIHWIFVVLSVVYADSSEEDNQIQHKNSIHSDCFDVFIPLINRLSNEAKETSGKCNTNAKAEKDRELAAIKKTRSELVSAVKRIRETLAHCSSRNDHHGYFECLHGIIEDDKKIVADITLKSSLYSQTLQNIEEQELKCFRNSVVKVKDKISNAINNLQYCLMSEDAPTPMSGETNNGLMHMHSLTESFNDLSQTTSSPEDYDYNNY